MAQGVGTTNSAGRSGAGGTTVSVVVTVGLEDPEPGPTFDALASSGGSGLEIVAVERSPGALAATSAPRVSVLVPASGSMGRVLALNVGVDAAGGEAIVVLAAGLRPLAGWLDPLVSALEEPHVALAGGVILDAAGRVVDGARIVWSDATQWVAPVAPGAAVDVDAVSGDCFAVRADAWRPHHGFDAAYGHVGAAGVDLCFRLRSAGRRVVLVPRSRAVAPPGDDHNQGGQPDAELDRRRLLRRWGPVLRDHEPPPAATGLPPWPDPDRAGRVAGLAHPSAGKTPHRSADPGRPRRPPEQVALLMAPPATVADADADDPGPVAVATRCQGLTTAWAAAGVVATGGQRVRDWGGPTPDIVWLVSGGAMRRHLVDARRAWPDAVVVVDPVVVPSLQAQQLAALGAGGDLAREGAQAETRERWWLGRADLAIASAPADAGALASLLAPVPVEIVLDPIDVELAAAPEDGRGQGRARDGVLWWGDFTLASHVDAAHWLCREVLPRVQWTRPGATVTLFGDDAPGAVRALAGRGVMVRSASAMPVSRLLASIRVAACPMRYGSGAALGSLRAVGGGLPLVATSVGLGATGLLPGVEALVADDADAFARAVIRVLGDDESWHRLSAAGQSRVATDRGPRRIGESLLRAVDLARTGSRLLS